MHSTTGCRFCRLRFGQRIAPIWAANLTATQCLYSSPLTHSSVVQPYEMSNSTTLTRAYGPYTDAIILDCPDSRDLNVHLATSNPLTFTPSSLTPNPFSHRPRLTTKTSTAAEDSQSRIPTSGHCVRFGQGFHSRGAIRGGRRGSRLGVSWRRRQRARDGEGNWGKRKDMGVQAGRKGSRQHVTGNRQFP